MKQVAGRAGVSLKTVSRVINAEPPVSPALRSRVEAAVEALGYRPNLHASRLRRRDRRTATIGLLLRDGADALSAAMTREIELIAIKRNVLVFTASSGGDQVRESSLITAFSFHRVDGLIVVGAVWNVSLLGAEHRAGTPIVFVDNCVSGLESDHVVMDSAQRLRLAVGHLIRHGHHRIGYLGGPDSSQTTRRLAGHARAFAAWPWPTDGDLVRMGLVNADAVELAVAQILLLPQPPTALVAGGTQLTISAYRELRRSGLAGQVALIGFDDELDPELGACGVSVVAPDPVEIARTATDLLFHRIDGDVLVSTIRRVPPRLMARGTGEIKPVAGRPKFE